MSVLDGLRDPVAVISPGARVIDSNHAFASMTGNARESIIGLHVTEISILSHIVEAILASCDTASIGTGRLYLDEHHYEATVTPCLDGGKVVNLVIELRDITSYIRLEDDALKANRHLMVSSALTSTFIYADDMSGIYEELLLRSMAIAEMPIGMIALIENNDKSIVSNKGMSMALRGDVDSGNIDSFIGTVLMSEAPMDKGSSGMTAFGFVSLSRFAVTERTWASLSLPADFLSLSILTLPLSCQS
jgi:hypothetical protein